MATAAADVRASSLETLLHLAAAGYGAALGLNTGAAGAGENRIEVYVR